MFDDILAGDLVDKSTLAVLSQAPPRDKRQTCMEEPRQVPQSPLSRPFADLVPRYLRLV